MEFCPKCGSVLIHKKKNDGCPRCSYSAKGRTKIKTSESLGEKQRVEIVKDKHDEVLPIVAEPCKECGNDKAYFWTVQTRSSDEAETKFYKCTKCGHTKRDYR